MTQARATLVESFAVPPETLFETLLDHEGMTEWIGAGVRVVSGSGGVGTVRRIEGLPGLSIDEEITYTDRPRRIVYRVIRGIPLLRFHRGEILVEPWGQTGSRVTWDILLDSPLPGLPQAMAAILRPALREGLGKLRSKLSA